MYKLSPYSGSSHTQVRRLALFAAVAFGGWVYPTHILAAPTISYVQSNSATPQTAQTTVGVTFTAAQVAGDLNVVVVGWNDTTATVTSVTDKSGNTYSRAVGPTAVTGTLSQSIYYAKNIPAAGAGSNVVTVAFSAAAAYPDIRILEYSGADPSNPVDVTAASSGTSATSSSGSATTTNPTDLLFGANIVVTATTGPGSGFTKRLITPQDGDIAEDEMVTATGGYSASAPLSSSGPWIMQLVAFRTPSAGGTVPTVTSVSPNSGPTAGGTGVTITGTNFATGATVTFGATAATNVVVTNSTTITATTPAGSAGAVMVTVKVSGQSGSLASGFTYVATPTVISVSPNSGSTAGGTSVTITGTNFVTGATVTFGGTAATSVVVVSSTSITAKTPAGSGAVTVTVTVSSQSGSLANGFTYVVTPTVTSVSPNSGPTAGGTGVTITGTNFATGATVMFGGTAATNVVVTNSTTITATTPAGSTGAVTVTVTVSGQSGSLASGFTYVATPTVTGVSPNSGSTAGGTSITITGTNFVTGATVTIGGTAATSVVVVSSTSITAKTPAGSGAVTVTVTVSSQSGSLANGFTYVVTPTVTSVSPNSGPTAGGTGVTITGTNFATGATVMFGGTAATSVVVVSSTSITAKTPAGSAGAVTVTVTNPGTQSGSLANGFTYVVVTTITYVQGAFTSPQTPQTSVSVTFTAAQAAGDLNVVVVGWSDSTATVGTVTDKSGNAYVRAVGPTIQTGVASQSIYYAKNIAAASAGANSVTVTFSTGAIYPDVRVLEYKGADPNNPVDVTAAGSGSSATSSSGAVTTTNATDLLFGANLVQTTTSGPGAGFTSRLLTSQDGDIAEDEMVTTIGSYSATAPLGSGQWIMQMVAFRTPASGDIAPPTAPTNLTAAVSGTQINLSWTASTDNVGVTGYRVERCQGTGCTTFAQIATSTTTTYSDTGLGAGSYSYRVRATDAAGNLSSYSNTASGVIPDTIPPTAPSNLTATAASVSQINLSWTASTDNVGVTGYFVERCQGAGCTSFAQIAAPTTTTYSDTGLTANSSYSYRVRATDAASNLSPYSNIATASTVVGAPTAPTNFSVIDGGPVPTVLSVQAYDNSTFLTSHTTTAFDSTGADLIVICASSHSGVTFTPSDSFGNTWIPIGGPISAATSNGFDLRTQLWYARSPIVGPGHTVTMGLSAPQPLVISVVVAKGSNTSSPIDAVSLIGSDSGTQTINIVSPSITTTSADDLLIGFAKVSTGATFQSGPNFTLQPSSNFLAAETGPAATPGSYAATFTINGQENWEAAVVAAANNPNQVTLTWTASTEIGGTIANYLVERCQGSACSTFAQIASTTTTTFNDTGLIASTSYSYRVRAKDTANNLGPYSSVVTITTPNPISSTPSAPGNLAASGPIVIGGQSDVDGTVSTSHTMASFNSTGGDLIVLCASSFAGVTLTPTDTFGNTWISIAGPTSTTVGADLRTQLWYAPNPVVGTNHIITIGLSAAQAFAASVIVVKGSNVSSPIDVASLIASDNGTQATSVASPSINTTSLNDLLIGFAQFSSGIVFLAGSTYTEIGPSSSSYLVAETAPAATPGTYAATLFPTSSANWLAAIVAAANNPGQITLSWTASGEVGGTILGGTISSYLVERCQGTGCTNFAQIATTLATSYVDTGLSASTTYNYRVRAQDTANTVGPYSDVTSVMTSGSLPSAPGNLMAASNRQGPITLSWTASTGTLGIATYVIQRCQGAGCTNFVQIATATGTTYIDSSVVSSTTYSYRVRAVDTAGNLSPFSNTATATTVGNQPPTAPTNLTATAVSTSQINLSWTASTSSIGLANYVVQRCQGSGCTNFAQVATPVGTTYSDTGLILGTTYSYQVEAIDIEGNVSPFSNVANTTTNSSTTTTITYVQGAYATPQSSQASVAVTFTAAQTAGDLNVVVVGWNDSTATVSTVTDKSGNTYTRAVGPTVQSPVATQSIYYAKSIVAAAAGANVVTVTFSVAAAYPDIRILEYKGADPTNPVDVIAASTGGGTTSSSGSVVTNNSTDLIFGANLVQTTTSGPGAGFTNRLLTSPDGDIAEDEMVTVPGSYSATAPLNSGQWIMQMVAFRSAGSCSGTPPTAPGNLTATAVSASQVNLSWTASVTCVGVAHYVVQRCQGASCSNFGQIGTATGITFSDTGLAANTSYSYQVQAVDNGGNSSPFSSVASATTLAISISPRVTALTFSRTQQFTSSAGVTWSVDGVVGGGTSSGTVTTTGLYTPPSSVGTHTVTATTSDQHSASATVYITNYPGTFTYHNDNLRTGQNLGETVLTLSNVNQTQFGKLFSYPLDGVALASPLYVANVNIPGQGFHNLVYVATEHDSVFAFDADGLTTTPLWQVSFLKSGVTSIPCADTGECGDISGEIGITSTPVIDSSSSTIYVVAATKEGTSTWVQRLHALDITTGAEKFGGPVVLQASLPGTGTGSSGGNVAFDPLHENQRTGLLLNNGVIYFAFGSHGDVTPWHGWVLGYNATTLQQTMKYNSTPNGNGGGIWQGGGGLATDTTGDIYFVTSNGDFDVNTGGVDYGDSVEKLSPSGAVVDYFTPHDQQNMSANNLDFGAGGPVMLVDQTTGSFPHLLITAGKSGTIYVINRDNLGKFNAINDNQIVQSLPGVLPNGNQQTGNFSTPVFFNGFVYFGAVNDTLKAFQLTNGQLATSPTSQSAAVYQVRGASFAVSANNNSNGILWALQNNGQSADNDVGSPGVLFAYDANNLTTELYDSSQAGSRDTLDNAAKFSIPLVANGKVFVAGQAQLTVFGLLP